MFKFIFSKVFLINLIAAILIAVIVVWGIFKFLDSYTHHGETISVPSLEGLTLAEIEPILKEKQLRYTILDSIYVPKAEKGVVLDQNPKMDDLVKENRTIYITVSKTETPKIAMPDLIGSASQRMGIAKLESYGLKIKKIELKPSENAGYVIGYKVGEKIINAGDPIEKGALITLIVGSGKSNKRVLVPYLINLTQEEAKSKLLTSSLNIGYVDFTDCKCKTSQDTLNAKVYKQDPIKSLNMPISAGSDVNIFMTCDTAIVNFDEHLAKDTLNELDSTATDDNH